MAIKKKETANDEKWASIKVTRAVQFDNGGVVFDMIVNGVTVYGCRIVEGKNGDFVSFPAKKGKDGKYYSHCYYDFKKEEVDAIEEMINTLI